MKYSLVLLCLCLGLVSGQTAAPEPPSCGYGCMNGDCMWSGYGNQYTCNCMGLYSGKFCEMERKTCISDDCVHGVCQELLMTAFCDCNGTGYTGDLCEIEIGCDVEGCQNGGECIDVMDTCNCTAGYTGDKCQYPILPCDSCSPYYTCEYPPCECQGWDCQGQAQMETTCYACEGPGYGGCHLNPWGNTTICAWGCMSRSYSTEEGMWFERGCAADACWNGCYDEDGMQECSLCCYDGYCNYEDPYQITSAGGRPGISFVGASLASLLLAITIP